LAQEEPVQSLTIKESEDVASITIFLHEYEQEMEQTEFAPHWTKVLQHPGSCRPHKAARESPNES
jgi:hypothetical protein